MDDNQKSETPRRQILKRISQFIGFLLGAKFFVTVLLTFALYVSTFFLFRQEESLRQFVFDFKVHGIIFCSILSILAGGIINQFYDKEKDQITKPFRTRLQSFLKQKYFLYAYVLLNLFSLGIASIISFRVFIFFLIYQFLMWFYSHKLSKIIIINNLTFVGLTLYPFFGMLVYCKTFSMRVFLMSIFLFLMLLVIDIIKDMLTKNADNIFGYNTIPNTFGEKTSIIISLVLLISILLISALIIQRANIHNVMFYYFEVGLFVIIVTISMILSHQKNSKFFTLNLLRFWIFIGILSMLLNGILQKF